MLPSSYWFASMADSTDKKNDSVLCRRKRRTMVGNKVNYKRSRDESASLSIAEIEKMLEHYEIRWQTVVWTHPPPLFGLLSTGDQRACGAGRHGPTTVSRDPHLCRRARRRPGAGRNPECCLDLRVHCGDYPHPVPRATTKCPTSICVRQTPVPRTMYA
jgi:hypothetical protein